MTGPTTSDANPLRAASSPLTVGVTSYVAVMRDQLEMTMQLAAAWAAAVSTMSSLMLAQGPGAGSEASQGTRSNVFRPLRSVRDAGAGGIPAPEQHSAEFSWTRPVFDQPVNGGMLRWLTEPPTLQTNLFDETIELLIDEDIKTAS